MIKRAFFIPTAERETPGQAGMSLLEVSVALFLVGVILTLMTKSGVRMFERWQLASTERDIRNQLNTLPTRAFVDREYQTFPLASARYLELPEGWDVRASEGLTYLPSGVCSGGQIDIVSPSGRVWSYAAQPPRCELAALE